MLRKRQRAGSAIFGNPGAAGEARGSATGKQAGRITPGGGPERAGVPQGAGRGTGPGEPGRESPGQEQGHG